MRAEETSFCKTFCLRNGWLHRGPSDLGGSSTRSVKVRHRPPDFACRLASARPIDSPYFPTHEKIFAIGLWKYSPDSVRWSKIDLWLRHWLYARPNAGFSCIMMLIWCATVSEGFKTKSSVCTHLPFPDPP
jgi:hypothetical protein